MIALFGTSADPPTAGHQAILSWLGQHFELVAVWASDNPFKAHQTTLAHRQEMLRLLIEETTQPNQNIALYPQLSDPKALTTVQRARQRWPGAELSFVVGSDLVPKLLQWYQIEALVSQVQLVVIPRPGYPLAHQDLQQLRLRGAGMAISDFMGPETSSTAYREGSSPSLTPAVAAYIDHEGLYTCLNPVAIADRAGPAP